MKFKAFISRLGLLSPVLVLSWINAFACWGQPVPTDVSAAIAPALEHTVELMNRSQYDSAQAVLSTTFIQTEHALTQIDLFYLHSLEAEIMYYSALFEQGLSSALRARALVEHSSDSILLGSAENLVGLLMMNIGRTEDALEHLRKAVVLLPKYHGNGYLSYNYHAVANIGECFLKMQLPDSAIAYSELSLQEADSLGKERGLALAIWNIAEARLIQGNTDESLTEARKGLRLVNATPHRDVIQIFHSTMMRAFEISGHRDSALFYLEQGLSENENALNTDFSRLEFLDAAINLLIKMNKVEQAASIMRDYRNLAREVGSKEQRQRIEVLKQFYERNRQLSIASAINESQQRELMLRDRMQFFLIALALMLVFLILIGLWAFRQRQRIQRMEFAQQMQIKERDLEMKAIEDKVSALNVERNRIASDLHDDIGASLSSIRIYSEAALMRAEKNVTEELKLIQRIKETTAGVMDRMSDIVWSISPHNDSAEQMVLRMKSFASEALGSLGVPPSYEINGEMNSFHPPMLARKNIYLIFKEAINNTAKYSNATEVTVRILATQDYFQMEISDNGQGFDVQGATQGNGIRNMTERSRAIGGTLTVNSSPDLGTSVVLQYPIARISYSSDPNTSSPLHHGPS